MNRFICMIGIERDGHGARLKPELRAAAMLELRRLAARTFGGYTLTTAAGGWINGAGNLIEESAVRLEIFTDKPRAECDAFARAAGRMLDQAQVVTEYLPADFTLMDCAP